MNKTDIKSSIVTAKQAATKPQIALPKLCSYDSDDSEDEDEKEAAKMVIKKSEQTSQQSKPATGLLGMLPQPKANQFMNKAKPSATGSASGLLLPRTLQPNAKKPVSVLDEDDLIRQRNFKRFKNDDDKSMTFGRNLEPKKFIADYRDFEKEDPKPKFDDDDDQEEEDNEEQQDEEEYHQTQRSAPAENAGPVLDQAAMMKLGGKKNSKEAIEILNVKANEIMGDNKAQLMKQITKEFKAPSNRDYFGSGSRKTHQITYLAYVIKYFFFIFFKR